MTALPKRLVFHNQQRAVCDVWCIVYDVCVEFLPGFGRFKLLDLLMLQVRHMTSMVSTLQGHLLFHFAERQPPFLPSLVPLIKSPGDGMCPGMLILLRQQIALLSALPS